MGGWVCTRTRAQTVWVWARVCPPAGNPGVGSPGPPSGETATTAAQTSTIDCTESGQLCTGAGAASTCCGERGSERCWLQKQHGGSRTAWGCKSLERVGTAPTTTLWEKIQRETLPETVGGSDRQWLALTKRLCNSGGEELVENRSAWDRCCSLGTTQKFFLKGSWGEPRHLAEIWGSHAHTCRSNNSANREFRGIESRWRDYGSHKVLLASRAPFTVENLGLILLQESSRMGSGRQGLNIWDLLELARSPNRQESPTPTCRITGSADQWGHAQENPAGYISTGKRQKSSEMAPNYTIQATMFLGPWSTKLSRAKRVRTGTTRGIQCPTQPWCLDRVAACTMQEAAAPFT